MEERDGERRHFEAFHRFSPGNGIRHLCDDSEVLPTLPPCASARFPDVIVPGVDVFGCAKNVSFCLIAVIVPDVDVIVPDLNVVVRIVVVIVPEVDVFVPDLNDVLGRYHVVWEGYRHVQEPSVSKSGTHDYQNGTLGHVHAGY